MPRLLLVVKQHPLMSFFLLTYALTWGTLPLGIFNTAGPLIAAIIVIALTQGRSGLRELGSRMIRWRVGWRWYLAAIGIPLAVAASALALNRALGAPAPSLGRVGALSGLLFVFGLRLITPLEGPMGEEPGWRGYALPNLQRSRSPLAATSVLSILVFIWHVPLFFLEEGMSPTIMVSAFLGTIAVTFWYTWLFNHTGGSVLMTIVMHAAEGVIQPQSFWPLGSDSTRAILVYSLIQVSVAIGIVIFDRHAWRAPASSESRIARRMRRVVLWPSAALLGLAAVGVTYQGIATEMDHRTLPPPGQLVGVRGHRLHINCVGAGDPTVILEASNGGMSAHWAMVQQEVAKGTRVCAYDRAGLGWSEPSSEPRDAAHISRDLHSLLANAGIQGPYVLVGHSYGGLYVRVYADMYPNEVAGLVLVDSSHPAQFARSAEGRAMFQRLSKLMTIGPLFSHLGVIRLFNFFPSPPGLPEQQRAQIEAFNSSAQHFVATSEEFRETPHTSAQVHDARSLEGKPLTLITAGEQPREWMQLQAELAALSSASTHRIVRGATHGSLLYEKRDAQVTSGAIHGVVEAVRTSRSPEGATR